ncbi:hypothetical protein Nepgr_004130 [Nepenthes gracilis]|uniref:CCHC-type domain-containing protein n=1 Tax=Nepenthes gracilis TaxID=150966 RepID=A0AAD3S0W8_NEPGR|nr:hypothetical protein Nepgr_004130 [Nepenthes gracilis]
MRGRACLESVGVCVGFQLFSTGRVSEFLSFFQMANRLELDDDDDFSEIYKEYTGPLGSSATNAQESAKTNKKSHAGSDEEEERDPNAVPTDFTSREAKVWEAKSKATERNWKKRKEEELICKICGESGHFTQGCPSTLGANRKSQDFFERVPAREKHVKALFTDKVIERIEKDIGCKIKMEEKFIIVSGKDRLILAKGVDVVHKIIKEEGNNKSSSGSVMPRSRSPERSPRFGRSESQRSHSSPRNASQFQQRFGRQDRNAEDRVREDLKKLSRNSPQAYGNDGARGHSSRSKSPARPPYTTNSYNSYDGHRKNLESCRTDGWNTERQGSGSDVHADHKLERSLVPQTLEELELEYKREAMDIVRIRDQQEDEENYKHREAIRDLREEYMKKLAILRSMHTKQWEEFLHVDALRQQQQAYQLMSTSGYGGYDQPTYSDYDDSLVNSRFAGSNFSMDTRGSDKGLKIMGEHTIDSKLCWLKLGSGLVDGYTECIGSLNLASAYQHCSPSNTLLEIDKPSKLRGGNGVGFLRAHDFHLRVVTKANFPGHWVEGGCG